MVYVDERLDVIEDVGCVHVDFDECVDEWLEVIEDVDSVQVGDVGCVDEVLEDVEDLDVVPVVYIVVDETNAVAEEN